MRNKQLWLQIDSGLKEVLLSGFETNSSNDRNNLHITSLTGQSNSRQSNSWQQSLLVAHISRKLLLKVVFLLWGKLFF